jgi:hypothetical protein
MIEEEVEQSKQRAITLDKSVVLRSSQFVPQMNFGYLVPLPQYYLFYKDERRRYKPTCLFWVPRSYTAESCAAWEVLYLDARAPPKLPSLEMRALTDVNTIVDAIQYIFPVFDFRPPLRIAVNSLLRSHYENYEKEGGIKSRPGRKNTGIIRKIDGVFCFDPDFKKRKLVDYGPQKSDAQTKTQIF